jgi:hypothetical protein
MKRIKGDKNEHPILRVRKPIPKPGQIIGYGKKYTKKDRQQAKKDTHPPESWGVTFEDEEDEMVY